MAIYQLFILLIIFSIDISLTQLLKSISNYVIVKLPSIIFKIIIDLMLEDSNSSLDEQAILVFQKYITFSTFNVTGIKTLKVYFNYIMTNRCVGVMLQSYKNDSYVTMRLCFFSDMFYLFIDCIIYNFKIVDLSCSQKLKVHFYHAFISVNQLNYIAREWFFHQSRYLSNLIVISIKKLVILLSIVGTPKFYGMLVDVQQH